MGACASAPARQQDATPAACGLDMLLDAKCANAGGMPTSPWESTSDPAVYKGYADMSMPAASSQLGAAWSEVRGSWEGSRTADWTSEVPAVLFGRS